MTPRISSPRVVRREAELAALEAVLARAEAGDPAAAVVAGEAGIGKTRLVAELESRAAERGAIVLHGACVQLDGGELPYAPLAAALRDSPVAALDEALAALPGLARRELAHAFPLLPVGEETREDVTDGARLLQGRLYELVLQLLDALGRAAPVLLVIDDAHWLDRSTRDLVSFLLRALRRERLAIVIAYRTGELPRAHPVRRMVAELRFLDRVRWVDVEPLELEAVAAQLAAILGRPSEPDVQAQIQARAGGNPLFAEELLAARLEGRGRTLPSSLSEALLLRFGALSDGAQHMLRCIAAVARPIDAELLHAISGVGEPDASRALHEAVDHNLLVHDRDDDTFRFRHEVVREEVFGALLPGERRHLHAVVGAALEAAPGAPRHAELAFHWRAAGRREQALGASIAAGEDAARARAFAEALRHFEAALQLFGELGERAAAVLGGARRDERGGAAPAGGDDPLPLDHIAVLGHACDAAKHAGDSKRAAALCRDALGRIDPAADPLAAAAFHERLGRLRSFEEDGGLADYRAALRWLPESEPVRRARLLTAEGYALWALGRRDESTARCEEALALAAAAGATADAAYARMVLGLAAAHAGDPEAGERHLREALATPPDALRPEDLLYGHIFLGEVLRLGGRFEAAATAMREGETHARRLGMVGSFGRFLALNAAGDLVLLGRWEEAEAALASVAGAALEPWEALLRDQVAGQLLTARGEFGRAEEALERGRQACEGAPAECAPAIYAALAELSLWRGRSADARAHVEAGLAAVGDSDEALYLPALYAMGARAAAEAAVAAAPASPGAADGARAAAAGLLGSLDRVLAAHPAPPPTALAHRATAAAELARARGEPAAADWGAAAERWDELGAPYFGAYARWRQAEALLLAGGGERGAAQRLLEATYAAATVRGAAPLRRELEGLARRARLPLAQSALERGEPAERPRAALDALGLTARELEVLALVGEGLTNRQIAARLFISPKTAGLHVSHILAKLDVANRTQAADFAHRQGLVRSVPA